MIWVIPRFLPLENSKLLPLPPPTSTYEQGVQARDSKWQVGPAPGLALVPAGHLLPWETGHITPSVVSDVSPFRVGFPSPPPPPPPQTPERGCSTFW